MCPQCQSATNGSQHNMAQRFNPLTGIDAEYVCTICHCEYVIKWHGRTHVIRKGMTSKEITLARHSFAIEETAAIVERLA